MSARILLVDDDSWLLRALRRTLLDFFEVEIATSGKEALELIQSEEPFQCIVTDLKMPQMDGVELIRRIKDISSDTPCIILSGNQDLDLLARDGKTSETVQLLSKPTTISELIDAINLAIQQRQGYRNEASEFIYD